MAPAKAKADCEKVVYYTRNSPGVDHVKYISYSPVWAADHGV